MARSLLLFAALALAACHGAFDPDGYYYACDKNEDCVAGYECVDAPLENGGSVKVCTLGGVVPCEEDSLECPCDEAEHCASGYCTESPNGPESTRAPEDIPASVCTVECTTYADCDLGACVATGAEDGPPAICMATHGRLGQPCKTSDDCVGHLSEDVVDPHPCIAYESGERFCGMLCPPESQPCPTEHVCMSVTTTEGEVGEYCAMEAVEGPQPCSLLSMTLGLSGVCRDPNTDCAGTRTCSEGVEVPPCVCDE